MRPLACLLNASYRPQRVLGISKLSAFEFLKTTHPDLSKNQLLSRLREQSKDTHEILAEHHRQLVCVKELTRLLHNLGISYRIIKRIDDTSKYVDWADLVITIGGDSTFLLTSQLIRSDKTTILGINPHPDTSNTFTIPVRYRVDIRRIFEKLLTGDYTVLRRSRIRIIMTGEEVDRQPFHVYEKSRKYNVRRIDSLVRSTQRKIADALQPRQKILPLLALNEVFIGEFSAAKAIRLTIQADDKEKFTTRSSGICVCTGSGSCSWFKAMNVQSVETIKTLAIIATGRELNEKEINELLKKYHSNLSFSPEDLRMAYMIREIYRTSRYPKPIPCPERQMCHKIKVRSYGFNAGLVLDGGLSLPFNDGASAVLEIQPEYALKNIILH